MAETDWKEGELIDWASVYEEWEKSSETQTEFCRNRGYSYSRFTKKVKGLIESGIVRRRNKQVYKDKYSNEFIPVNVSQTNKKNDTAYCEIRFRGSGTIRIEDLDPCGH